MEREEGRGSQTGGERWKMSAVLCKKTDFVFLYLYNRDKLLSAETRVEPS